MLFVKKQRKCSARNSSQWIIYKYKGQKISFNSFMCTITKLLPIKVVTRVVWKMCAYYHIFSVVWMIRKHTVALCNCIHVSSCVVYMFHPLHCILLLMKCYLFGYNWMEFCASCYLDLFFFQTEFSMKLKLNWVVKINYKIK